MSMIDPLRRVGCDALAAVGGAAAGARRPADDRPLPGR